MNKTNNNKYTYADFARDILAFVNGEIELTESKKQAIADKAQALLDVQTAKAEYNKAHPNKSKAKGASAETLAKANKIKSALTATPKTTAEINAELGTDFTALQVANAMKYIEKAQTAKVIRDTVNNKGLKAQKEYTAYFIG